MASERACFTCRHERVSSSEPPCFNCIWHDTTEGKAAFPDWEPKESVRTETPAGVNRTCYTCRHKSSIATDEPCRSCCIGPCDDDVDWPNWEPEEAGRPRTYGHAEGYSLGGPPRDIWNATGKIDTAPGPASYDLPGVPVRDTEPAKPVERTFQPIDPKVTALYYGIPADRIIENPAPGRKDDQGKLRYDLIPVHAEEAVAAVLTYGAAKYAPENWRHVPEPRSRYYAAARRHLAAWMAGEQLDPESGLPHLAHAATCLLFLLELDKA